MVSISLVACKDVLNDREKAIWFEMVEYPDRYLTHTLVEHNRLCAENNQCVLCLLESKLLR